MIDYAIILAGGKGMRMGAGIPKQFLPIGGKPILMRTIERFREYDSKLQIILVLPEAQQEYWEVLCEEYDFQVDYKIAKGGRTRFHSIQNGLCQIPDDAQGVVAVHDGVRPFPSVEVIGSCYRKARETGAAIPVIPVFETLRHIPPYAANLHQANAMTSVTVPRSEYVLVQTPQAFHIQLHKQAYRQEFKEQFTDDASVVESLGHSIHLVEGNRENIKITTPLDLMIAEAIINNS